MLRDASPSDFAAIYVVCGRTDMRLGIDSLAAIIENRYHLPLFVPNTLFLFCGRRAGKIRGLLCEYSRAVTPQVRQAGNRLSGLTETAYASLLA